MTNMEVPATKAVAVEPAVYNQLVHAARLRDIRLIKSEFGIEAEAVKFQADWKLKSGCEVQQVQLAPERDLLLVWVLADAVCKVKSKRILWVKCRYLVVYDIHGAPEEAAINAFAKRVARFAAYPYFRSHFAELTSQAGVHAPPLPIIKETRIVPSVTQQLAVTKAE